MVPLTSYLALVAFITTPLAVLADIGEPCTVGNAAGVCLKTSTCKTGGGSSTPNHCPGPADEQCCTKSPCSNGAGACGWANACSGTNIKNLCPGPDSFQCCVAKADDPPPSSDPPSPPSGGGGGATALSQNGVDFIAEHEGFRADFYDDGVGVRTIGYGHACQTTTDCKNIKAPISKETGKDYLKSDAAAFEECLKRNVNVPLNQNQFDALISFLFNLGCGKKENLWGFLNRKQFADATANMKLFNKGGDPPEVIPGLVKRRNEEVELFNS